MGIPINKEEQSFSGIQRNAAVAQATAHDWYREATQVKSQLTVRRRPAVKVYGTPDSGYNAFPSFCQAPNGSLIATWRNATSHGATDGIIMQSISLDGGRSWGPAATIIGTDADYDLRQACISQGFQGRLVIACFKLAKVGGAHRVVVRYSDDNGATWSSEAVLPSTGWTYLAVSSKIRQYNGALYLLGYGKLTGDTNQSIWSMSSSDNGATWDFRSDGNPLLDGDADGVDYTEPERVWMFERSGFASDGQLLMRAFEVVRDDAGGKGYVRYYNGVKAILPFICQAPCAHVLNEGTALVVARSGAEALTVLTHDQGKTWDIITPLADANGLHTQVDGVDDKLGVIWYEEIGGGTGSAVVMFRLLDIVNG